MDDFKALLNNQIKKATSMAIVETKPATSKKAKILPPSEIHITPKILQPEEEIFMDGKVEPALTLEKVTKPKAGKAGQNRNINRVTVNLFEADSRALSIIREKLGSEGHDFSSRSDSIKIGLRLAAKAKPEDLAKLFEQVKSEDRRYTVE
jgi:hypothetical protein